MSISDKSILFDGCPTDKLMKKLVSSPDIYYIASLHNQNYSAIWLHELEIKIAQPRFFFFFMDGWIDGQMDE